jgi:hypothetical protein
VASPSPAPAATEKYWKPLEITVKMPNGVICKVEDIGLNHTMKELYDRVAVNRNTCIPLHLLSVCTHARTLLPNDNTKIGDTMLRETQTPYVYVRGWCAFSQAGPA